MQKPYYNIGAKKVELSQLDPIHPLGVWTETDLGVCFWKRVLLVHNLLVATSVFVVFYKGFDK